MTYTDIWSWLTSNPDGIKYMTLLDSSANDRPTVFLIAAFSAVILLQYIDISLHSFRQFKGLHDSLTKRYILSKTMVFLWCGVAGYGYTLLSVFAQPYKLRVLLLFIVAFVTYKFQKNLRAQNQISRILDADQRIQDKFKKAEDQIKALAAFSDPGQLAVEWNYLKALNLNQEYTLPSDTRVMFKKTKDLQDRMDFYCTIDPGGAFTAHNHPNTTETIEILQGNLIDQLNNLVLTPGDVHKYSSGQVHAPWSSLPTILNVTFKKTNAL